MEVQHSRAMEHMWRIKCPSLQPNGKNKPCAGGEKVNDRRSARHDRAKPTNDNVSLSKCFRS